MRYILVRFCYEMSAYSSSERKCFVSDNSYDSCQCVTDQSVFDVIVIVLMTVSWLLFLV